MQRVSCLPAEADHVLVGVNPRAGARLARHKVDHLATRLRDGGWQVEVLDSLPKLMEQTARLRKNGRLRVVVAAGGDGTVAEIVNRSAAGVPITILPLGTANLLARYLGLSDVKSVALAINAGTVLHLDAGRAGDRLFLVMATCGIDAEIVKRLHERRRGHIRRWTYLKPILDSIRSYQYPPLSLYLTADAETDTGEDTRIETTGWISLFNLPCYGAGFRFTPEATGVDGLLDLCAFRTGSTLQSLRYLSGVLTGRHRRMRGCVATRVRVATVESATPVPLQLDGDPAGVLPCRFEVVPGRLRMVVPPDCRRLPRSERH